MKNTTDLSTPIYRVSINISFPKKEWHLLRQLCGPGVLDIMYTNQGRGIAMRDDQESCTSQMKGIPRTCNLNEEVTHLFVQEGNYGQRSCNRNVLMF